MCIRDSTKNTNDENALDILKNGVKLKILNWNQISFTTNSDNNRSKQLKAILIKYKHLCSNKVFKVEDNRKQQSKLPEEKHKDDWKPKIEFESELQKKLREVFGIDVVFHQVDEKSQNKAKLEGGLRPFGYTLIDHKTETIYKGSDILKMNNLFEFTSEVMDKKLFESLKDYNLLDKTSKPVSYTHLDVYKRQILYHRNQKFRRIKGSYNIQKNSRHCQCSFSNLQIV